MSRAIEVEKKMKELYGKTYWKTISTKNEFDCKGIRSGFEKIPEPDLFGGFTGETKPPHRRVNTQELIELANKTIRWGA